MPLALSPGTKLGHYEIHSQLGAGGMGEVYLAQCQRGIDAAPASVRLSDDLAQAYYLSRRYDDGIRQAQKSIEMDPDHYSDRIHGLKIWCDGENSSSKRSL